MFSLLLSAQVKRVDAPTLTENEAENQLSNPSAATALGTACRQGRELMAVDPEIPVLQKDAVFSPPFDSAKNITVNVDALNATVIQPPTPPSGLIRKCHRRRLIIILNI
ncbi:hypothetical protein DPMN_026443 [Dreissena polymorpha]|uniref:Uncharacterized protein n=1 Tax=Dreissena polymorpha TaxID=45954 RepID=A0A9D4LT86_DREPO|nr:hypothetical protein DPMN_026443 [Dreissena polymorpha]